jgi:hypothetical protein
MNTIQESISPITKYTVLLATALLLAACSSDAGEQTNEQQDADTSTNADVSADADAQPPDADAQVPDTGTDTPAEDSGADTAIDTGAGADADASADAGPPDDAHDGPDAPDAEPDASVPLCDQITPLEDYPDWSRASDIESPFGTDEDQTFETLLGAWPGNNNSTNLGVLKGEYFALSFTTGDLDASSKGKINREQLSGAGGGSNDIGLGTLIASFSRCPGDFDPNSPALPAPDCVTRHRALFEGIRWGGPGSGENCELDSNTDYYLNVVYTESDVGQLPPDQATCRDDRPRCGHLYQANGTE